MMLSHPIMLSDFFAVVPLCDFDATPVVTAVGGRLGGPLDVRFAEGTPLSAGTPLTAGTVTLSTGGAGKPAGGEDAADTESAFDGGGESHPIKTPNAESNVVTRSTLMVTSLRWCRPLGALSP